MGKIKGAKEFAKFERGEKLTRKQAMLAQCFSCNGFEDSAVDCQNGTICPLYEYHPHKNRQA